MSTTPVKNTLLSIEEPKLMQLKGMIMAFEGIFKELAGRASDSLMLADLGAKDDFAKTIEQSMADPWANMSELHSSIKESVKKGKEILITRIVKKNKHFLDRAQFAHEDGATHIFLVLRDDNEVTRQIFYDFLEAYETYSIFESYPMIFHFVSDDMLGLVDNPTQISLKEDEQVHQST